jgi:tetratricopeptide (TPR) repeat protein
MPRVLISYSHDSPAHMDRVWNLSERLRGDGIDCRIDQHEQSPAEGWPRWCSKQIKESDFVLVACTEIYLRRYEGSEELGKGRGGTWEGMVITQELYNAQGKNTKFVPILFDQNDEPFIPIELQGATYYNPGSDAGYEDLLRRISGQPRRRPSPVAPTVRVLPTQQGTIFPGAAAGRDAPQPELPKLERRMASPFFTVPLPDNPFFTERANELAEIKDALEKRGIFALTGMGGMGKTQTATRYCYLHRDQYPAVLWVRAENDKTLYADLTRLAALLKLPEATAQEQKLVLEAVKAWLDAQPHWLLVLDNVVDLKFVAELTRKANANGRHLIVTTQSQATGAIRAKDLPLMAGETGALLLLRRAAVIGPDAPLSDASAEDVVTANAISSELGGLPLALDQAGAYISETGCGLAAYLERMKDSMPELLARRGELDNEHLSVAATFEKSLAELAERNRAAADLVKATAFLAPDAIPEEIFTGGASNFAGPLQDAAAKALTWDETVGATLKFSLLDRDAATKTLSVHRTVQIVVRWNMKEKKEDARPWAEQVVQAVNAAFPGGAIDIRDWPICERLLPHAQACAGSIATLDLSSAEAALLLNQAGYYLSYQRARYAEAEPLYRASLDIAKKYFGQDSNEVAVRLNNLAQLLQATNRLAEAEPLMRRALEIDEKSSGPDHPAVARDLNNLALLLKATNRLADAEPLYRRALEIDEKSSGPDHPDVARDLNNLARLLQATNRLADAEPLFRRAVEIFEKAYGPEHPQVATGLNNLALLLQDTNRLDEAEPLMRRALVILEASLGPEHPSTITVRENLSILLRARAADG